MAYIFLDESGDLGFKKSSSKWFLFTIALIPNNRDLERVIKKVWRSLRKKHKKIGELHAAHEKPATRKQILKKLAEINELKILSVILNKQKVYVDLQNQKNYLYNFTANILLGILYEKNMLVPDESIDLCADRKDTKKRLRDEFVKYLSHSMAERKHGGFSIKLRASHDDKSLQAVDFISWAIFQKYEKDNCEYYELIKNKIVEERLLFT
ncbi:MAG: DUF3800 domain-containing protein [Candidatus Paceibacterota bacterium]